MRTFFCRNLQESSRRQDPSRVFDWFSFFVRISNGNTNAANVLGTVSDMATIYLDIDQRIQSALVPNHSGRSSVETILFPESYLRRLTPEKRKQLPKRILPLLRRYQKFLISKRRINQNARKTLYQRNMGKLVRLNLRIDSGVWAILGVIAAAHGVSRCFLVNYMIWLDESGVGDSIDEKVNVGSPTFQDSYSYLWNLDLVQNRITKTLEFTPNPIRFLTAEDILHHYRE